jgi:hypothetical protein
MGKRIWNSLLATVVASAVLGAPLASEAGPKTHGRTRGPSRIYQDPATAKGYESGYDLGLTDGRDGQRYDPVRHRDYRDAERGYVPSYGSRDGYQTNFRSGFRQGYEDGYRDGTRAKK